MHRVERGNEKKTKIKNHEQTIALRVTGASNLPRAYKLVYSFAETGGRAEGLPIRSGGSNSGSVVFHSLDTEKEIQSTRMRKTELKRNESKEIKLWSPYVKG